MYILENKKRKLFIKKVQDSSNGETFGKVSDKTLAHQFQTQKEIGDCLKNPTYKKLARKFGQFQVSVVPREEIDSLELINKKNEESYNNIEQIFEHNVLFPKPKDKDFYNRGLTFLEETGDVYKSLIFVINVLSSLEDCCSNMEHKQREIDLIIEDMLHELRKPTTKLDACKMSKFTKVLQVQSQKRIEVKLNRIMCQAFIDFITKNDYKTIKENGIEQILNSLDSIHNSEYKNRRIVLDDVWNMFESIKKCNSHV